MLLDSQLLFNPKFAFAFAKCVFRRQDFDASQPRLGGNLPYGMVERDKAYVWNPESGA